MHQDDGLAHLGLQRLHCPLHLVPENVRFLTGPGSISLRHRRQYVVVQCDLLAVSIPLSGNVDELVVLRTIDRYFGFNWTTMDMCAQKTPQFAGFCADSWTSMGNVGRLGGGPTRIRTWNQGIMSPLL